MHPSVIWKRRRPVGANLLTLDHMWLIVFWRNRPHCQINTIGNRGNNWEIQSYIHLYIILGLHANSLSGAWMRPSQWGKCKINEVCGFTRYVFKSFLERNGLLGNCFLETSRKADIWEIAMTLLARLSNTETKRKQVLFLSEPQAVTTQGAPTTARQAYCWMFLSPPSDWKHLKEIICKCPVLHFPKTKPICSSHVNDESAKNPWRIVPEDNVEPGVTVSDKLPESFSSSFLRSPLSACSCCGLRVILEPVPVPTDESPSHCRSSMQRQTTVPTHSSHLWAIESHQCMMDWESGHWRHYLGLEWGGGQVTKIKLLK